MRTAVSLPDELFLQAEAAAKKLRVSRNQLYAQTLATFLRQSSSQSVTEQLNEVYSHTPAEVDPELQNMQIDLLEQSRW